MRQEQIRCAAKGNEIPVRARAWPQGKLFTTMMEYYLLRGAWCCSSRGNGNEDGRVYTPTPPPLRVARQGT